MLILCGCHDTLSLPNILRLLAPWTGLATQIAMRIVTTTTTLAASISISATS